MKPFVVLNGLDEDTIEHLINRVPLIESGGVVCIPSECVQDLPLNIVGKFKIDDLFEADLL